MPPKKEKCDGVAKTVYEAGRKGCITANMKEKLPPKMLLGLIAYRKKQADGRNGVTPKVVNKIKEAGIQQLTRAVARLSREDRIRVCSNAPPKAPRRRRVVVP